MKDKVHLKDLVAFNPKSKIKAGEGKEEGLYKFFTSSTYQSKYINEYLYNHESIIIGTGGNPNIHYCNEPFAASTDCLVFSIADKQKNLVLLEYIYYYLKYNIHILQKGFKGAGLKHISKKYVEQIEIPIQPIETQHDFIKKIQDINSLYQTINIQIEDIKLLTTSYFLERVGPHNKDYKSWPTYLLEDLTKQEKGSIRSGPFGSDLKHSEFTSEGVFVLGIDNAVSNMFRIVEERYISLQKYEKLKRYTVYPDDVIITIMGTTGRSAVVPSDIGTAITTKHLATLTLNTDLCVSEFISYCIHSHPEILHQIKLKNKGAIMDGLNLGIIKKLKLKLPPKKDQMKFKEVLKTNNELVRNYEKQLSELETLRLKVVYTQFYS